MSRSELRETEGTRLAKPEHSSKAIEIQIRIDAAKLMLRVCERQRREIVGLPLLSLSSGLAQASGTPRAPGSKTLGRAAVLCWEHTKQDDMNQVEARKPQAVTSNDRSF